VYEKRQRRHVEREPLSLPRPVEKWLRERPQPLNRICQPGNLDALERPWLREPVRRIERRCVLDLCEEPLPELANRVLSVPIQRRRERRVVAVALGRLLLLELSLRPDIGAKQRLVLMNVGLGALLFRTLCCQCLLLYFDPILNSAAVPVGNSACRAGNVPYSSLRFFAFFGWFAGVFSCSAKHLWRPFAPFGAPCGSTW
jgi:hypothetical protein